MPVTTTARQTGPKYVPAFTVTKLEGTYQKTIYRMKPTGKKDKNGNEKTKLSKEVIELPRGFLVETPRHMLGGYHRNGSFHVPTIEKLEELGFADTEVPLVDLGPDGGDEPVGTIPNRIKRQEKVNA